MNVFKVRLF